MPVLWLQYHLVMQKTPVTPPPLGLTPQFLNCSSYCEIFSFFVSLFPSLWYDVSVRLSVTEVHWHIIANLGFKFRSHFAVHCGRRAARSAACGRIISCHASQCWALLFVYGTVW